MVKRASRGQIRIRELPTHVVVNGKRYPLEDPAVEEHNRRCESGKLSMFEWILPDGKRLGDATKPDLQHAIAVSEARAAVDLACVEVLEVFDQDRAAGQRKLHELYERFEVWPPLDATGAQ